MGAGVPRVALDVTPLLGVRTGVGIFVRDLLDALSLAGGAEIVGFAVTWRGQRDLRAMLPPGVSVPRHRPRVMPARIVHAGWERVDLPDLSWWTGRVDVVHGTNYVVPPAKHSARVVSVHDCTMFRFPELCTRATLASAALLRKAALAGVWFQVPTRFVGEEVSQFLGVEPDRVKVVPYALPRPVGMPSSEEPGARLFRESGGTIPSREDAFGGRSAPLPEVLSGYLGKEVRRYVLALGTVEPRKDYPTLVDAFGAMAGGEPDTALVIAGPKGWGQGAFDQAWDRSPARKRIAYLGAVDEHTKQELLNRATVLAYPSLYEGFGFPPLEAMAAGVPVLATMAGSVPEVVGDAAELVPPKDASALADALARLLDAGVEGARLRERLVAAGRERLACYSWERTAAGFLQLYRDAWADTGGLR